jgi:hypothetical protein
MGDGRLSTEVVLSYSENFINGNHTILSDAKQDAAVDEFIDTVSGSWSVVPKYSQSSETYEKEHWQGRCCKLCGRLNSK